MIIIFQVFIILIALFFGFCLVIDIKEMINEFKNPYNDRRQKFHKWLKREDKSITFNNWLRKL